jgi:uncharacterized protein with NRDE domain
MCSIFFAYDAHPRYRLIAAANRDEFYARPTAAANFWADAPEILAGRDLVHGGAWLGLTRGGRFAAVTNYREARPAPMAGNVSRGNLVVDFLRGTAAAEDYLREIQKNAGSYSGFNLLVGEINSPIGYFSNRAADFKILESGVYGLSNHLLDTPWPKVERGKNALRRLLEKEDVDAESLFEILRDNAVAPDADLPDTGVGLERERLLSPIFIETPIYGTRCSTVLMIEKTGKVLFAERTHRRGAKVWDEARFEFAIQNRVDANVRNGYSYSV